VKKQIVVISVEFPCSHGGESHIVEAYFDAVPTVQEFADITGFTELLKLGATPDAPMKNWKLPKERILVTVETAVVNLITVRRIKKQIVDRENAKREQYQRLYGGGDDVQLRELKELRDELEDIRKQNGNHPLLDVCEQLLSQGERNLRQNLGNISVEIPTRFQQDTLRRIQEELRNHGTKVNTDGATTGRSDGSKPNISVAPSRPNYPGINRVDNKAHLEHIVQETLDVINNGDSRDLPGIEANILAVRKYQRRQFAKAPQKRTATIKLVKARNAKFMATVDNV
jgi:hypothetical protein